MNAAALFCLAVVRADSFHVRQCSRELIVCHFHQTSLPSPREFGQTGCNLAAKRHPNSRGEGLGVRGFLSLNFGLSSCLNAALLPPNRHMHSFANFPSPPAPLPKKSDLVSSKWKAISSDFSGEGSQCRLAATRFDIAEPASSSRRCRTSIADTELPTQHHRCLPSLTTGRTN